jgi:hypothetical protein
VNHARHRNFARWAALAVIVGAGVFLAISVRRNRWRSEIRRLAVEAVENQHSSPETAAKALSRLRQMGDAAYPFLGEMLPTEDSPLKKYYYATLRPRLPRFLLRRLPDTRPPPEAQWDAASVIEKLGPVAARGMNRDLRRALPAAKPPTEGAIVRSLMWSAPESSRTVEAIASCRASPEVIMGLDLAPGSLGSRFLGSLRGTNALPLIHALCNPTLRTSSFAFLGGFMSSSFGSRVPDAFLGKRKSIEKMVGLRQAEPLIVSNLMSLADNASGHEIRLLALGGLCELGTCPKGALLAALQPKVLDLGQIFGAFEVVAKIGPAARETLPWIEQFTSIRGIESVMAKSSGGQLQSTEDLRREAIIAACRVAPEHAGQYAPELVSRVGEPGVLSLLFDLKPLDSAVLAQLSATLSDTNPNQILTAAVILSHEPTNSAALTTLRLLSATGELGERLDAAYWLWKSTGDAGAFLVLAGNGLSAHAGTIRVETSRRLAEIGHSARAAGPSLRAALEHPDSKTREAAGLALWKVAPELMPQIRE